MNEKPADKKPLGACDYAVLDALKGMAGGNRRFVVAGMEAIADASKQHMVGVGFAIVKLMFADLITFQFRGSDKNRLVITLLDKAKGGAL